MRTRPRTLLFTGPGKGKTTAAAGLILRALAAGRLTLLVRFCKAGPSGEVAMLSRFPGLVVLSADCGRTPPADHPDFSRHRAAAGWLLGRAEALAPGFGVVVLDEICGAVARKLVPEAGVLALRGGMRRGQTLVLTGRYASPGLIAAADTVSEILCLKHAFDQGVTAEEGVEY